MKSSTLLVTAAASTCASTAEGFTFMQSPGTSRLSESTTARHMGLFDGVKEAFGSDEGMGELDDDRVTPIDRWMGWNAKSESPKKEVVGSKQPSSFVDSMDTTNYLTVELEKPMGIVFEENDDSIGGIFVFEISEGSNADTDGALKPGDQLVAVGDKKVSGLSFDEALGTIIDSTDEKTKLVLFRGPSEFLYGPTGASQEWLDEFISSDGLKVN